MLSALVNRVKRACKIVSVNSPFQNVLLSTDLLNFADHFNNDADQAPCLCCEVHIYALLSRTH